jgi:hypothetical protein
MMAAVKSDMDRAAPGHCRIMIRLQEVRARVHDSLSWGTPSEGPNAEGTDILAGILGVAIAARTEEMRAFTSVCMLVYERVEPLARSGRLPRRTLELIAEWSANAELYVRRPRYVEFAKGLVRQLNDAAWGSRLSRDEQDRLIRALLSCSW